MQEQEDTDIKIFFKKLLQSISLSILWLIFFFTAGIKYHLLTTANSSALACISFYVVAVITAILLTSYLIRMWKH